jgi:hypothetical protein
MATPPQRVLVLGAGFTKAFFPRAPLLIDDYDGDALERTFAAFPSASAVLRLERTRTGDGRINVERLMSRLDGGMPHDTEASRGELGLLLVALKRSLIAHITRALDDDTNRDRLMRFARYCVLNNVTTITFNYDDALDYALWAVKRVTSSLEQPPYWHPDGGYGFFCRPSVSCVIDSQVNMDPSSCLLLKLHGSLNWRARRGSRGPYVIDAIVHHERWYEPIPEYARTRVNAAAIEAHLEPEPFIVPPVLLKSALIEQPILRAVWQLASEQLANASEVTFVGYSMPTTDIAATFLFAEALLDKQPSIRVIDVDGAQMRIATAYRTVFPRLADEQFSFHGALRWADTIVGADESPRASAGS